MKEYEFHEAANIFPLDEEHLDELAEDIRKHGQQVAIEIMDNQILDGRRRYLACKKAKVNARFIEVNVDDPVAYVRSLNLFRRHLSASQLATVAARAEALIKKYADAAKQRQRLSEGRGQKGVVNLPYLKEETGPVREKVGKDFGISGKYVDLGRKVIEKGTPKLQAAVDKDLLAVSTAARAASLSPAEQDALAERAMQAAAEGKGPRKRPAALLQEEKEEIASNGGRIGVGTLRAHEAIDCLRRIPKNDALRLEGLEKVEDWIRRNK